MTTERDLSFGAMALRAAVAVIWSIVFPCVFIAWPNLGLGSTRVRWAVFAVWAVAGVVLVLRLTPDTPETREGR